MTLHHCEKPCLWRMAAYDLGLPTPPAPSRLLIPACLFMVSCNVLGQTFGRVPLEDAYRQDAPPSEHASSY